MNNSGGFVGPAYQRLVGTMQGHISSPDTERSFPMDRKNKVSRDWRVGFEIEVVLDDLGETRFADQGRMDEASPAYCRAVASILRNATGRDWHAPRKAPAKTGYYVVPEYDIDPALFPYSFQVAGVELITPPVAIEEADGLRREIAEALAEFTGFECQASDRNDILGWHINVDPGQQLIELDPARFSAGVDEVAMLLASGRIGQRYTGLQRHAWGPTLLREIRTDPTLVEDISSLEDLLRTRRGIGKGYAANFGRPTYLELRHYGVSDCFGSRSLEDLVGDALAAFEVDQTKLFEDTERLRKEFFALSEWLNETEHRFTLRPHEMHAPVSGKEWDILFDGRKIGGALAVGVADFQIYHGRTFQVAAGIHGQSMADTREVLGLLCLDMAESSLLGHELRLANEGLSEAIAGLCERLS